MAKLVYVDETGSSGRSWRRSPYLTLVGVVVEEQQVQPLAESLKEIALSHLGWLPAGFEFHGQEIWNGSGHWADKTYDELIAAYEEALGLLDIHELGIAHATIDRRQLHSRYDGAADANAYRLALQFLLEKIDRNTSELCIVVADESKEQELQAISMVADMQRLGVGEVPGKTLTKIIDCLHFVSSKDSYGVQMADLAAFVLGHRRTVPAEHHPNAEAAMRRLCGKVWDHTYTWREVWP